MPIGETAGRYRILEKIAAGGMGEVYRASMGTVGGLDKTVALKLVRSNLAQDEEFSALFVEEAKVAMSLSHANVVQSFDVGLVDDRWFLAMEFVDGIDLAELIAVCDDLGQPLPHRHAVLIVVEALKGLDYAHRRTAKDGASLNIVHRDISPGNLLLSLEGEVKIADFGIAKSTLRAVGSLAGTVKGKIPYMAPEQLRGQTVDRRADLYSVGAVLYEVLTGQRVVPDEEGTQAIPKVLGADWPLPRDLAPSTPAELERIVTRALNLEPGDRYPSAAAMRQDLERFAMDSGYLLSTADLADFIAEVLVGGRRPTHSTLRPGEGAIEAPAADAADDDDDDSHASASDPFDAFLGRELQAVQTGQPFSVFTSAAEGRRLATAAPRDSHETRDATPSTPRPSDADVALPPGAGDATPRGDSPWPSQRGAATTRRGNRGATPAGRVETEPPVLPKNRLPLVALGVAVLGLGAVGAGAYLLSADDRAGAPPPERGALESEPPTRAEPPGAEGAGGGSRSSDPVLPSGIDPPPEEPHAPRAGGGADGRRPGGRHTPTPGGPAGGPEPAPAAAAQPAQLSINTDPWSYVSVDGSRIGATPVIGHGLPAGRHRIRFENPSQHLERAVVVELAPGEHRRITLDLAP